MVLEGFTQWHLQAAGSATPLELLQSIELDQVGANILCDEEEPLNTIHTILSSNDIAQNEQGWCEIASRRSLRYTMANRTSEAPAIDLSLAALVSLTESFFNRQPIHTRTLPGATAHIVSDLGLPDILGIRRSNLRPGLYGVMRALGFSPLRIIASVSATEITGENLHDTMVAADLRTACAHERYLAVGRISKDPDDRRELKRMSELIGIGVIQIIQDNGMVYPREILPVTFEPGAEERILRSLGRLPAAAQELLAASLSSTYADTWPH